MGFISVVFLSLFMFVAMIIMFLLWVGTLVLQVFLSKMNKRWPGLIFPGIVLGISLFIVLEIAYQERNLLDFSIACDLFEVFLVINIGTAIYLLIYFLVRFIKRKKKMASASQTKAEDL